MSQIFKQFTVNKSNSSNVCRSFSEESETDFGTAGHRDSLSGYCRQKLGLGQSADKKIGFRTEARTSVGSQDSLISGADPTASQESAIWREGRYTSSRVKDQVTKASIVFLKTVGKVKSMTSPKRGPGDASDAKAGKMTENIDGAEKDLAIQKAHSEKSYASGSRPSVSPRSSFLVASLMNPLLPGDNNDRAGSKGPFRGNSPRSTGPPRGNSATVQQLMEEASRGGVTELSDMIKEKVDAATLPLEKKITRLQASCEELLAAKDQLETLVFKAEQEAKLERKNAEKHRLEAEQLRLTLETLKATANSPMPPLEEPAWPEGIGADDGERPSKSLSACSQTSGARRTTTLLLSPAVSSALQEKEKNAAAAAPKASPRRLTRAGTMPVQPKAADTAAASEAAKSDAAKPGKQRQLSRLNSDVFSNKPGTPLAKVAEAKSKPDRKIRRSLTCQPVDLAAVQERDEADDAEEDGGVAGHPSVAAEREGKSSGSASGTNALPEASDTQCPLAKAAESEESMLLELEKPALQMRFNGGSSRNGALLEKRDKCSPGTAKDAKMS